MSTPYFSIIIPTYNRARLIQDTLDSVFSQRFTSYEVIVVDNCSTDNTEEVLAPLISSGKIRFIKHDKNYERAKSRNTGLKNARGVFITYLDSDDFMYPDNLQDAYDFAQQHPELLLFHNLNEVVTQERKIVYRATVDKTVSNPLKEISKGNFLSCIGVFLKKGLYEKVYWEEDPSMAGFEDYEYWFRVLAEYPRVGRINKINSGILEHPQRSVNTDEIQHAIRRIEFFLSKMKSDEKVFRIYKPYFGKIQATLFLYLAYMGSLAKNKSIIKQYLKKAVTSDISAVFRRSFLSLSYKLLVK